MKCNYCGCELNDGARFCRSCGKKVEEPEKTKVFNRNMCPNCGNTIEKGALFCNQCGCKVGSQSKPPIDTQHIRCPGCGTLLDKNLRFCTECGMKCSSDEEWVDPNPRGKQPKEKQKTDGGLIALIILLIVVLLGCAGTLFWIYSSNRDVYVETPDITVEENEAENIGNINESNDADYDNDYDEVYVEGAAAAAPLNEFAYSFNQTDLIYNPTYTRIENYAYSYYCAVPQHFIADVEGEVYHAPDNTALMKIYAEYNSSSMSVEQVMNEYISEVGGTVTYSASGDTWFAVSMEKDGIGYYMKGFVDHYIREFTFSFPLEYSDVYDEYINYIEDNFARTDVEI